MTIKSASLGAPPQKPTTGGGRGLEKRCSIYTDKKLYKHRLTASYIYKLQLLFPEYGQMIPGIDQIYSREAGQILHGLALEHNIYPHPLALRITFPLNSSTPLASFPEVKVDQIAVQRIFS